MVLFFYLVLLPFGIFVLLYFFLTKKMKSFSTVAWLHGGTYDIEVWGLFSYLGVFVFLYVYFLYFFFNSDLVAWWHV